jgi:uncharacterized protein (TIGR01244 family)
MLNLRTRAWLSVVCVSVSILSVAAQEPKKETVPGIVNFTKVDATVACGGALSGDAVGELKTRGYRAIINFRLASENGANVEAEQAAATQAGIKYIHLPFNAQSPDPKVVDAFLSSVADRANQPVFVHCGSANRVGAMWLIKRVLQDGWAIDKATAEAEMIGLTSAPLKQFALDYLKAHGK